MVKTKKEIEIMREGGRRLAEILQKVSNEAKAEINVSVLNALAEKLIRAGGDKPAFLNYKRRREPSVSRHSLCFHK